MWMCECDVCSNTRKSFKVTVGIYRHAVFNGCTLLLFCLSFICVPCKLLNDKAHTHNTDSLAHRYFHDFFYVVLREKYFNFAPWHEQKQLSGYIFCFSSHRDGFPLLFLFRCSYNFFTLSVVTIFPCTSTDYIPVIVSCSYILYASKFITCLNKCTVSSLTGIIVVINHSIYTLPFSHFCVCAGVCKFFSIYFVKEKKSSSKQYTAKSKN